MLEAKRIDDLQILNMLNSISDTTPIYYLHPSFGYYFEQFYMNPDKGIFRLTPYPSGADSLDKPALTKDQVLANSSIAEAIEKKFDAFAEESERLWENQFLAHRKSISPEPSSSRLSKTLDAVLRPPSNMVSCTRVKSSSGRHAVAHAN